MSESAVCCPIDSSEMKLLMLSTTSFFACQKHPLHRLGMVDFSDLVGKNISPEQAQTKMLETQVALEADLRCPLCGAGMMAEANIPNSYVCKNSQSHWLNFRTLTDWLYNGLTEDRVRFIMEHQAQSC